MDPTPGRTEAGDPLIDEVRAVRKAISDRVGDDFDKLGEYLRRVREEYRQKTGRFQPDASDSEATDGG